MTSPVAPSTLALPGAALVSALLLSACSSEPPVLGPKAHPIIILDVDTLRADHLGCYGYSRDTSPNIDALAAESTRFEWAFSQAPHTLASQASIFTSLYPSTHGAVRHDDRLTEDVVTLAEVLKGAGFITAAFVDGGYLNPKRGFTQGFDLYDANRARGLAAIGPKVKRWVRRHAAETFFLLVHTYDVHKPYDPPPAYRSLFLDGLEPPTPGFEPSTQGMRGQKTPRGTWLPLPARDVEHAKALYDAEIRFVDDWIGELMAELKALGLYDRATIILLSDHGEAFQEHGSIGHSTLYTTVTRIPLIIRRPGAGGAVISKIVESIDVMPTVLELVGAAPPPGIQGRSLLPLLRGEPSGPYRAFGESPARGAQRFIALDGQQLLTNRRRKTRLFDLRADPLEQHDLAKVRTGEVERLSRALERWQAVVERIGHEPEQLEIDREMAEELRALGYLD